jgi:hypothetical protein
MAAREFYLNFEILFVESLLYNQSEVLVVVVLILELICKMSKVT